MNVDDSPKVLGSGEEDSPKVPASRKASKKRNHESPKVSTSRKARKKPDYESPSKRQRKQGSARFIGEALRATMWSMTNSIETSKPFKKAVQDIEEKTLGFVIPSYDTAPSIICGINIELWEKLLKRLSTLWKRKRTVDPLHLREISPAIERTQVCVATLVVYLIFCITG